MRKLILLLAFAILCLPEASSAQNRDRIVLKIGEIAKAFHPGLNGRTIEAWWPPSNEHDVFFMEDMLSAAGLERNILMLEADVDNAYALIDFNKNGEPFRLIIYNVNWLSSIYKRYDDLRFARFLCSATKSDITSVGTLLAD